MLRNIKYKHTRRLQKPAAKFRDTTTSGTANIDFRTVARLATNYRILTNALSLFIRRHYLLLAASLPSREDVLFTDAPCCV